MRSKNTLFTISIILLASLSSFAQTEVSYKEMMENNSYNFYEVVDAANAYFDANGRTKGSGWKNFERWKAENESKFYPSGDRSNVDFYGVTKTYTEIANQAHNLKNKASFTDGWVELGPWSANNITSHYSPGIGRVQDFWVNPTIQTKCILQVVLEDFGNRITEEIRGKIPPIFCRQQAFSPLM